MSKSHFSHSVTDGRTDRVNYRVALLQKNTYYIRLYTHIQASLLELIKFLGKNLKTLIFLQKLCIASGQKFIQGIAILTRARQLCIRLD